jgi:hypothetical protein
MVQLHSLIILFAFATTSVTACKVSLECPPSLECIKGVCQLGGCRESLECPGGQLCIGGQCTTAKYIGEGEDCTGVNRCWADLWCDRGGTGTCKRYLEVGETCTDGANRCERGAVCNLSGKCASFGFAGPSFAKPCNATDQCLDEEFSQGGILVCRYGEFLDLVTGRRIWYNGGRICVVPAVNHFGENCVDDGECGIGLHCKWNLCLPILVTQQYAPDGFACQTDADCCSERCETHTSLKNGKRGTVRVCARKTTTTPALPGC